MLISGIINFWNQYMSLMLDTYLRKFRYIYLIYLPDEVVEWWLSCRHYSDSENWETYLQIILSINWYHIVLISKLQELHNDTQPMTFYHVYVKVCGPLPLSFCPLLFLISSTDWHMWCNKAFFGHFAKTNRVDYIC